MKHSDIVVVGAGIAGLTAAITAARQGASVSVLSYGAGVLTIGSGMVDFLGYDNGKRITDNPFDHLQNLPTNHPYNIVGKECVSESFDAFMSICAENGLNMSIAPDGKNKTSVSVLGTLRPTYMSSEASDAGGIFYSEKIGIVSVEWLKDCEAGLAVKQLKLYEQLKDKTFGIEMIKSPFEQTHRAINCLDLARYVDNDEGFQWLKEALVPLSSKYDILLIPPICGISRHEEYFAKIRSLGLDIVEMSSIPPGVGGVRVRRALYKTAVNLGVSFSENCFISRANTIGDTCVNLVALHNDIAGALETEYFANKFIIATGGILGGGIKATPGKVTETIFGLDIACSPLVEDWSQADFFAEQPFESFGVSVDKNMTPIDKNGAELYSNVYFAGRSLGFYDFSREKSGYGVAISTGRKAALEAVGKSNIR